MFYMLSSYHSGCRTVRFVIFFLNFTAKSGPTFQKISASLPNFQILRRQKSGLFFGEKITAFATHCYTGAYSRAVLCLFWRGRGRGSRGGLPALQRGPYCIATGLPLQPDGVPVVTSRGPYGSSPTVFLRENDCQKLAKFCVSKEPGGPPGVKMESK